MKLKIMIAGLAALFICTAYLVLRMQVTPYDATIEAGTIPSFSPIPADFKHRYDAKHALPFLGSALLDIDNDGVPELWLSGGYQQPDGLLQFTGTDFVNISEKAGLIKDSADTSYGAAAIDTNYDGYTDLFVARNSGLYLYANNRGRFTRYKLEVKLTADSVPIAIAAGDINLDGHIDLFISCFTTADKVQTGIFNNPHYGASSLLLKNNGDNTFTDITESAGLSARGDSLAALIADLDNDRRSDLVIIRAGRIETWRNQANEKFQRVPNPAQSTYGYFTSISLTDYNQDGLPDLFLPNVGSTIPLSLLRGDLHAQQILQTHWALFINQGEFRFEEHAATALLADYEFGWGAVFADFNLDGLDDLVVAENYIHYPPQRLYRHAGRLLIRNSDQTFAAAEKEARVQNRRYGITPIVADFNRDGYPDLVWVNLAGPTTAFINNGGNAHYSKLLFRSSPATLGAKVTLSTRSGTQQIKHLYTQQGFASQQTPELIFGLGRHDLPEKITVQYPGGKTITFNQPPVNQILEINAPAVVNATTLPPHVITKPEPPAPTVTRPATILPIVTPQPAQIHIDEPSTEDELERLLTK